MRIQILIYLAILFAALLTQPIAGDRVPIYYIEGTGDRDYPVFDISPSLGTVLIDNDGELTWVDGVRIDPDKAGAVLTLLEGTAPDAEWAVMAGGAIPYRRSAGYAWFARTAFTTDLEPFFPGDEVIGLIEKHKIMKDGRISPKSESYITVVDDDFIGEICRSIGYDTFESARGYNEVTLDLLEGSGEALLIIEDTACQFRVSSYDWRRSGIGDFFRYREGGLHRDGFTVSAVEVGIGNVIGGVTSEFSIGDNGRLYQRRTAYVEIDAYKERFKAESKPLGFTIKQGEIARINLLYDDMMDGITRGELKLYKLPDDGVPPIDIIPPETFLDVLVFFPLKSEKRGYWYLVESKNTIDGKKHIGWAFSSGFKIFK